jgi:Novel STAND NTPase 1
MHKLLGRRLAWPQEKGLPFPWAGTVRGRACGGVLRLRPCDRRGAPASGVGGRARNAIPTDRRCERHGEILAGERRSNSALDHSGRGNIGSHLARGTDEAERRPGWAAGVGPLCRSAGTCTRRLSHACSPCRSFAAWRRGGGATDRARALARIGEAAQYELHTDQPLRAALVLLVDQLEELFAQAVDDDERAAVGESLKQLVTTRQVWCTATLRANFYEPLPAFQPPLARWVSVQQRSNLSTTSLDVDQFDANTRRVIFKRERRLAQRGRNERRGEDILGAEQWTAFLGGGPHTTVGRLISIVKVGVTLSQVAYCFSSCTPQSTPAPRKRARNPGFEMWCRTI